MKVGKALHDPEQASDGALLFSGPRTHPRPLIPLLLPAAQVWSNDVGAPPVAVMVSDASLDNPALVAACNDHKAGLDAAGMDPVQLMCGQPSSPTLSTMAPTLPSPSTYSNGSASLLLPTFGRGSIGSPPHLRLHTSSQPGISTLQCATGPVGQRQGQRRQQRRRLLRRRVGRHPGWRRWWRRARRQRRKRRAWRRHARWLDASAART